MTVLLFYKKGIKWIENYSRGNTNRSSSDDIKAQKQELADLLKEDAKLPDSK
jgi:hypothetical protein